MLCTTGQPQAMLRVEVEIAEQDTSACHFVSTRRIGNRKEEHVGACRKGQGERHVPGGCCACDDNGRCCVAVRYMARLRLAGNCKTKFRRELSENKWEL